MYEKASLSLVLKKFKEIGIEFFNLQALDLRGRIHSVLLPAKMMNESILKSGVGFDASSYGFAKPEKSDMVLIPDLDTMVVDPFRERKTAIFHANIYHTDEKRTRYETDPRYIAEKAENSLIKLKIGTNVLCGPEFEFFIFKEAEYKVNEDGCYYRLKKNSNEKRNFYHSASPDDEFIDFKNEAVYILQNMGIDIKYHHHEVAVNQHEIETKFTNLLKTADEAVLIKYVLFNLAKKNNLYLTFMPKPFYGKAGNGFHIHQYIVDGKRNVFYEKGKYGNISDIGISYITGLLYHSGSLSAFANPSTNSYKRLVKGYEAPVKAVFATSNRNAAIRIPTYVNPHETRIEYRPGDATSNPYLFLSAMILAGIDGIMKNLLPEKYNFGPFDGNTTEMKGIKNKLKELPCSLIEAIENLKKDQEYLKYNDTMNDEIIQQWIKLKTEELIEVSLIPHPKEFELYFNF